ncbi:uncharacterized protein LOC62_02G002666 [Vanrija pseudolonga]|uniref:Uncharacterized protein n=1 Tax=Vanrija pseudolonga TaxID=143232 RepID=A0AAF0Y2J7_9TREE|nr:hypothetical protein LOC62_02G002666 [Vanrija pseudolonga]
MDAAAPAAATLSKPRQSQLTRLYRPPSKTKTTSASWFPRGTAGQLRFDTAPGNAGPVLGV